MYSETHLETLYLQICWNDGSCVFQSSLEVYMAYDSGIAQVWTSYVMN